jgi:hypothetical protein
LIPCELAYVLAWIQSEHPELLEGISPTINEGPTPPGETGHTDLWTGDITVNPNYLTLGLLAETLAHELQHSQQSRLDRYWMNITERVVGKTEDHIVITKKGQKIQTHFENEHDYLACYEQPSFPQVCDEDDQQ